MIASPSLAVHVYYDKYVHNLKSVLQMGAPAAAKNCCIVGTEALATQTKLFSKQGNKSVVFVSAPFCSIIADL